MLRPTIAEDTEALIALADEVGVFKPLELTALREVLDDYHAANRAAGHRSTTLETATGIEGFVYFAPAAMTERTWYLYWIAVRKRRHAGGLGGELLAHCEAEIRRAGGRLLLIETSSLPHYEPARRFYLKQGYERHATVGDFYADGDDLVVFRKRLAECAAAAS